MSDQTVALLRYNRGNSRVSAANRVVCKGESAIEISCRAPIARMYYLTVASDEYVINKKN